MSVKVMSWVWEHSQSKSSHRLVLLAIADCAADHGGNAYPSLAALVSKTGLSTRTVQACLRALVDLGELTIAPNAGPRGCNRYRIIMTPADLAPPQISHPPADTAPAKSAPPQISRETPAESAPGTVLEPSEEISSTKRSLSAREKRGTRIPDDFTITESMTAWAREHVPELAGKRETEKFIDYWRAASGRNAVKRDWVAAWRVWMRNAVDRYGPAPGNAVAVRNGHSPPKASTTDQRVAAGLQLAEDLKRRRQS